MAVSLTVIGGIVLLLAIILHLTGRNKRPKGFPPGPRSLPILGNLHQIGLEPQKSFIKLGKKYGGIFGIYYGSYRAVVLNDLKLIKQCLSDPAFSGRPKLPFLKEKLGPGGYCRGLVFSELQHWSEQRRFAMKNLRDFGFGKNSMEGKIQEESQELVENLYKLVGRPIKTQGLFNAAILNSLWRICAGARMPQNDSQIQKLFAAILDVSSSLTALAMFFPTLAKLFPKLSGFNHVMAAHKALRAFIQREYNSHKETLIPGQSRDLMDAMIEEVEVTTDPTSSFYQTEGEASVINSLEDLFLGGAETTSMTMTWLCLFMAVFPEIQDKMSEEIQKVIGPSRLPELIDKSNMPFTVCVIMEVLRFSPVFPIGGPHNTHEEVNIGGYTIPKDTVVTANLYAVLHDEEIWGDPEVFRPERFLLPDGTPNINHEAFITFSVGKRVCPGEKLAKDELFLFTVSVFQHFRLTTNPNGPKPSLKPKPRFVLSPIPHELILHDRF